MSRGVFHEERTRWAKSSAWYTSLCYQPCTYLNVVGGSKNYILLTQINKNELCISLKVTMFPSVMIRCFFSSNLEVIWFVIKSMNNIRDYSILQQPSHNQLTERLYASWPDAFPLVTNFFATPWKVVLGNKRQKLEEQPWHKNYTQNNIHIYLSNPNTTHLYKCYQI